MFNYAPVRSAIPTGLAVAAALLLISSAPVHAADTVDDPEVEHLIQAVGQSDCVFIRNGKRHAAPDAADHLRLKYRKGKKYIDGADEFIDKLASESSWTGKPYSIECPGSPAVASKDWLRQELSEFRLEESS